MCNFSCFLFLIGLNAIISLLFRAKHIILSLLSNSDLNCYGKGSWALITACTDGIGKGFADSLAKKGFNIVQVGRNREKLQAAANDLKGKYGVEVKNVIKDFKFCTKDPIHFFTDICTQTSDLDISIIINNIGTGDGIGKFKNLSQEQILDTLALNLFPITFLSKIYAAKLQSRPEGGAIINLSSILGNTVFPGSMLYSCSKAYDRVISTCLSLEEKVLKTKGAVSVLCYQPGYVDTPLTKNIKSKFLEISINECAEAGLRCVGAVDRSSAHWKHIILNELIDFSAPIVYLFQEIEKNN